ncbi:conserved hypothetical protein [Actinomyces sp. oral taxon 180 str. F0310]|nr:conserved hypothetical protein [Actinomyces sp. oral taxon 180 str. F0310]
MDDGLDIACTSVTDRYTDNQDAEHCPCAGQQPRSSPLIAGSSARFHKMLDVSAPPSSTRRELDTR